MTLLSEIALEKCTFVIQAIKELPFNKELTDGSLPLDKFAYYIEQDALYLQDFARSLAMIASKAPLKFVKNFLSFSEGALIAEQTLVHNFFRETFMLKETAKLTPATLAYTSYLLQMSATAPVEIAIASVLPCFCVYKIVGDSIAKNAKAKSKNPYFRWIKTYSSKEFGQSVQEAISIFDEIAISTSDLIRHLMIEAFYKSTVFEWHFWHDSYHQTIFDHFPDK